MPTLKDLDRVILVGVIHTDKESIERVRDTITRNRPDVVAVELDRERYQQLQSQNMTTRTQTSTPPTGDAVQDLMQQIALLESILGDLTGSMAGREMMTAIEEGRKISAKIALVDRPIQQTVQALMRVPLDEIYKMLQMIPVVTEDIKEEGAGTINDEGVLRLLELLRKDSKVKEIVEEFRREFPAISRVLIDERDEYVAKALATILDDVSGKIVAVLGSGHIQGVRTALERLLGSVGHAS